MTYLVWSFDYSHASAGPKVLHRLCHELRLAGQDAYIGNAYATNPEWDTPHPPEPLTDFTAIYPEIVRGNPWGAPRVVRWVLNTPGRLGGDGTYDPSEMVWTYSRLFHPDAPLLRLPAVETDIYTDRGLPRTDALLYVGKGHLSRPIPGREITHALRHDREALADALNRATVLYTFDAVTGMVDVARLCGCPVVVVPDGSVSRDDYYANVDPNGLGWDELPAFDPVAFRAGYLADVEAFRVQLADFIAATGLVLA